MCFRNCGIEIQFDNTKVSRSGKKIPLEMDGTPHKCPMSDYGRKKSRHAALGVTFDEDNGFTPIGQFIISNDDYCKYCGLYTGPLVYSSGNMISREVQKPRHF